ncbi:uncharacterized protein BCR38DRAFT_55023 [Pseudomassariella vexata]|uniref:Uncharacterized protein n=1 Tax=Pseudomassariella vexata TaxID=1141098 RepID=A0A1Y2DLK2_9PEZI|nr:uncharacterized protein BCR38DRAFT_55023 [Pseudomassariella vexata]ORY60153.1 hypothetical protein BCR38DRAFT_55023 [Pseudomassariella vexata]
MNVATETPSVPRVSKMTFHRKSASQVVFTQPAVVSGSRSRRNSTTESDKRTSKDSKSGRWLTHIKDWVTVSEPSTQALKQHKKDTYKRAGIALSDPQANAKLHIPVATLPPEAIKPCGPGPEPEEIAQRKAEQKRRLRQSYSTGRPSRGSRSSTSQHSSLSNLPSKDSKDGM